MRNHQPHNNGDDQNERDLDGNTSMKVQSHRGTKIRLDILYC